MHFDQDQIHQLVSPRKAVDAIERALRDGLRAGDDPARQVVELSRGQFLLMPSEAGAFAGVKVATVAPGNPAQGLPRIQATYLLFDSATLQLVATLDGTAVTAVRTPAVSIAAVRGLLDVMPRPARVVSFGWGPQGRAHLAAMSDVHPGLITSATWIARDRAGAVIALPRDATVVSTDDPYVAEAVAGADVIICATTAREPMFRGMLPRDGSVIVAVGSHEADARELDATLMSRSQVVVEDIPTALRESGDVIMAIDEGRLSESDLTTMTDVITGRVPLSTDVPTVFKSSGMAWEDLVIATEVAEAAGISR